MRTDHITTREPLLAADDGLDDALGTLSDLRRDWAPVASGGRPTDVLSVSDAIAAYRTALNGNIRQVRGFRAGGVEREDALVIPRGDLAIAAGDRLSIFAEPAARPELMAMLERRIEPSAAAQVTPVAGPGTL